MRSIKKAWRRLGIVGLSTIVATTAMTGIAATTYAAVNDFTNTPRVAALLGSTGVSLGTQTFTEPTPGAFFATGTTDVVLTLSGGAFTAGVTPMITVPSDYTMTNPATAAGDTYTFTVTAPAAPVVAVVSVSGLTIATPLAAQTLTLNATIGAVDLGTQPVVNVVTYDARTGGASRYETAAALFDNNFSGAPEVVLSSGVNFPDALSASYLAGALGTGTLLTLPNTLSAAARLSIISSSVDTVFITGGPGAVSNVVQSQIEATHIGDDPFAPFIDVVRLGGDNRFETNLLVNEFFAAAPDTVLLASGKNFPDALAMGPVAYQGFPLILTQGVVLGSSEITQLVDFAPTNVVIAGGTGVVSAAIAADLTARGYHVVRLAGASRTLTAAAIATWATTGVPAAMGYEHDSLGFVTDTAFITTGDKFADALAAGPVAGANLSVIMPTNSPTSLGLGIPAYFGTKSVGSASLGTTIDTLVALGLSGAVSDPVMKAAAATIGN